MSLKSVPILSIDPSTKAGWALWLPEKRDVEFGTWVLGNKNNKGATYNSFWVKMEQTLEQFGVLGNPKLRIVFEEALFNPNNNSAYSLKLAAGWEALLYVWCERRMMAPPVEVLPGVWFKLFMGSRGRPGKKLQKGEYSRWKKEQTVLQCNRLGLHPKDDNQADAIGMLWWFMNQGVESRNKARAEVARKKALKKAQTSLPI